MVDSVGSLAESEQNKIFGQIGTLLSVAIFEQRGQAIEIKGPTDSDKFPTSED